MVQTWLGGIKLIVPATVVTHKSLSNKYLQKQGVSRGNFLCSPSHAWFIEIGGDILVTQKNPKQTMAIIMLIDN